MLLSARHGLRLGSTDLARVSWEDIAEMRLQSLIVADGTVIDGVGLSRGHVDDALLVALPSSSHLTVTSNVVVIVIVVDVLANKKSQHVLPYNKHNEALQQLRGWSRTSTLRVEKPGAVWWHWVQVQRSRAWSCCS